MQHTVDEWIELLQATVFLWILFKIYDAGFYFLEAWRLSRA